MPQEDDNRQDAMNQFALMATFMADAADDQNGLLEVQLIGRNEDGSTKTAMVIAGTRSEVVKRRQDTMQELIGEPLTSHHEIGRDGSVAPRRGLGTTRARTERVRRAASAEQRALPIAGAAGPLSPRAIGTNCGLFNPPTADTCECGQILAATTAMSQTNATRACPACGLVNPNTADVCDCGYAFGGTMRGTTVAREERPDARQIVDSTDRRKQQQPLLCRVTRPEVDPDQCPQESLVQRAHIPRRHALIAMAGILALGAAAVILPAYRRSLHCRSPEHPR